MTYTVVHHIFLWVLSSWISSYYRWPLLESVGQEHGEQGERVGSHGHTCPWKSLDRMELSGRRTIKEEDKSYERRRTMDGVMKEEQLRKKIKVIIISSNSSSSFFQISKTFFFFSKIYVPMLKSFLIQNGQVRPFFY